MAFGYVEQGSPTEFEVGFDGKNDRPQRPCRGVSGMAGMVGKVAGPAF